jgi:F420-0:gamma-glutamyl ligase-like protein
MDDLKPNKGKELVIEVSGKKYARLPIKTRVIGENDNIAEVAQEYVKPYLKKNDLLFISERIVAISQGRAFKIKDIKPSRLANFLVKFVHKSPYGIGLGSPWTMELAIKEAGILRILLAAIVAAVTKPLGVKGLFYKAAGKNINAIDGPCSYTLPPYNEYAKLGPKDPEKTARAIKQILGCEVVIIDANDLGVAVLGKSDEDMPDKFCQEVFSDNPLGQSGEQTPLCLVREI